MRIARYRNDGRIRLGVLTSDTTIGELGDDLPDDVGALLASDPKALATVAARADFAADVALAEVTLLAPIVRPPKFLAIGLNYAEHISETGMGEPGFPLFFNKQSTCITGPGGRIHVPKVSEQVDFEGELGVVIGQRCRHVPRDDARSVVAGYLVVNDVSVRDWQKSSPTMTLGKSFDTHGPIGPWLVTPDELPDPHGLRLRTWVNGELMQDASTSQMIRSVWEQIEVLSTVCTLEPGDIIATGTPAGVGMARDPQVWLRPGDTVRVEIEGIGAIENPVVVEPERVVH
jgi:2-keto-4-pentenoate hydratase/2-oxohepta-3-ene-1,7-dioic acid hydratase in catechol pathway